MFALSAIILNRTGVYKLTLINTEWWNRKGWDNDVDIVSKLWIKQTSNRLLGNADHSGFKKKGELGNCYNRLLAEWKSTQPVNLDHFRAIGNLYCENESKESEAARTLAEALVKIYIIADASCFGLGFLGQSLRNENLENRIFMATANLLLNSTGSLSTVTKFHGVVIPKMRTPQTGLVARSLGHHLTFHNSEVEIIWRTYPRLEQNHRSLNILAVPYPPTIDANDFEIVPDNFHPVRYFKGNVNKKPDKAFLSGLVKKVGDFAKTNTIIDIIVLPEMALSEVQYNFLLAEFKTAFEEKEGCIHLPTIVTGIMKKNDKKTGYSGADETFQNEVRMAVFFSGNWYTTTQRKHHRWQLDRNQIHQYELESHLSADRKWFEFAAITQRRLTILAPNAWLAFTALICEDLARQEPVGEVIRGIGPTLLMALLSDGPQLKNRWSARYASILADDPGTAVLSLTSLGMALRSKSPDGAPPANEPIVGLWKDMVNGWCELAMEKNHQAMLFTISATFQEELTLDARSDRGSASVFQLENIRPQFVKIDSITNSTPERVLTVSDESEEGERFNNIRELSALQFATDAILDMLSSKQIKSKNFANALKLILSLLAGYERAPSSDQKFRQRITKCIEIAWVNPAELGIAASAGKKGKVKMQVAARDLQSIVDTCNTAHLPATADLYDLLIKTSKSMLDDPKRKSEEHLIPMSILYNLHNRVTSWNPSEKDCFEIEGLNVRRAQSMIATVVSYINGEQL